MNCRQCDAATVRRHPLCDACNRVWVAAQRTAHNKLKAEMNGGRHPRARLFACVDCAKPATDWDHRDYSKPLAVEAVCRGCNLRRGPALFPVAA